MDPSMFNGSSFNPSGNVGRDAIRFDLGGGATLLVTVEEGRVRTHLSAPPGAGIASRRARIGARLAARLLLVDS
jgi:exopolyphosphatase/pppGpp-phosphohydrolase